MVLLLNRLGLVLILMTSLFLPVFSGQYKKSENDFCPRLSTVLCLRDVLLTIATSAKEIDDITDIIQENIERQPSQSSLNEYVDNEMEREHGKVHQPKSNYHYQFMNVNNNINRTGLINLFKEQNYAYSYLYNSIKNILKLENIFGKTIDNSFRKVLSNLQKNILCNYRNILYMYSETWTSIDEIDGIEISKTRKRSAPSFLHNAYSIIIIRLLKEWKENVDNVVINLESKLVR